MIHRKKTCRTTDGTSVVNRHQSHNQLHFCKDNDHDIDRKYVLIMCLPACNEYIGRGGEFCKGMVFTAVQWAQEQCEDESRIDVANAIRVKLIPEVF